MSLRWTPILVDQLPTTQLSFMITNYERALDLYPHPNSDPRVCISLQLIPWIRYPTSMSFPYVLTK